MTTETNETKAIRRRLNLLPRYRVLPDRSAVWDDLVVASAVGEWVLFDNVKQHFDAILSMILRAQHRADMAEARTKIAEETLARLEREHAEYAALCAEQAATIRQFQAGARR